jgi:iron complex transport system ATP-binding protein
VGATGEGADGAPVVARTTAATLRRGDVVVLDGVDLTVRAGERWALLGANGCGKTSLLSLLGALQHPTSGTVEVLGARLGAVDVRDLWPRIGHVRGRQRPAGPLTVRQVVLTGLTGTDALPLRWSPSPEQQDRAAASLAAVGVQRLADRTWSTLSNGEQRRTLIARALVTTPDLLLLDEPAAGLDLPSREALVDALDGLAASQPRLASVLVSHHVEELPASTTSVALMRAGRLLAAGTAAQVLRDAPLSDCFGLPLRVSGHDGRWTARSARSAAVDVTV